MDARDRPEASDGETHNRRIFFGGTSLNLRGANAPWSAAHARDHERCGGLRD